LNGDSLFVDEWHISQLSAFLLYPLLKVYMLINKSTEGIILSFRYIYMAVQLLVSLIGYCLLKKQGRKEAMLSSILFVIFIPYTIMALSYNTIGLMAVYLIACLNIYETRYEKVKYFFVIAFGVAFLVSGVKLKVIIIFILSLSYWRQSLTIYLRNAYNLITIPFAFVRLTAFIYTEQPSCKGLKTTEEIGGSMKLTIAILRIYRITVGRV
jgi:hypothetical protein